MAELEEAGAEQGEATLESVVLDLTDVPLDDLAALPPSVLGETLRRLRTGRTAGDPFVTGFSESQ
ncbi:MULTISPECIES: FxSxx-COOH cyclophane-containing RiPP peptide [Streptomyces]|jgi:FXSXX-COOH protein|uniref:FxSxx-COOH cyclophane-containing RiPP peptide n=1 Tax=Streptomyces TaxID=1883 RepID=UPI00287FDB1B|nr:MULTISPECIES: FxSxx-COOH cyclophane-containing RiPP peptide [Streptomyces]WNF66475.1 FxSxx-COOH cyclophane-containing RiPP peptide [Streptomyces sp. CGMCC 4.1456]